MAQNVTSVPGTEALCAAAAAAADAMAPLMAGAVLPDDTALSRSLCTVDFSAWVALVVRR